jgi:hypothetical protein
VIPLGDVRRRLLLGALGALAVAAAILAWSWFGPSPARTLPTSAAPSASPGAGGSSAASSPSSRYDGGRIERTIADRAVRDELRRRILERWALGSGETDEADAAPQAPQAQVPMPTLPSGEVDPEYIRSVIREDMFPMARACYEELLSRHPDAGGRVEMFFKIAADEHLGGVIDDVSIDAGKPDAIRDDAMNTCVRESLLTLAFRPPPKGGSVTVGYPILFSPREDED